MNGPHDLGGRWASARSAPEKDEPVFHAAMGAPRFGADAGHGQLGDWNMDEVRSACENLPPAQYLSLSYYEIWMAALQKLVRERGHAGAQARSRAGCSGPETPQP